MLAACGKDACRQISGSSGEQPAAMNVDSVNARLNAMNAMNSRLHHCVQGMNDNIFRHNPIRHDEVLQAAFGMDGGIAMAVLSKLQDKALKGAEVNDPTSWVCAAFSKERKGQAADGTRKSNLPSAGCYQDSQKQF